MYRKKQSTNIRRVRYYPWFQESTVGLGTCPPQMGAGWLHVISLLYTVATEVCIAASIYLFILVQKEYYKSKINCLGVHSQQVRKTIEYQTCLTPNDMASSLCIKPISSQTQSKRNIFYSYGYIKIWKVCLPPLAWSIKYSRLFTSSKYKLL